jgi:hypothetical protein
VPSKSDEHGFIFVAPMGYNPAPVIASSHRIMKSWPPVVEHGTHGGMIVPTMPVVLDFFAEIAAGE